MRNLVGFLTLNGWTDSAYHIPHRRFYEKPETANKLTFWLWWWRSCWSNFREDDRLLSQSNTIKRRQYHPLHPWRDIPQEKQTDSSRNKKNEAMDHRNIWDCFYRFLPQICFHFHFHSIATIELQIGCFSLEWIGAPQQVNQLFQWLLIKTSSYLVFSLFKIVSGCM